MFLVYFCSFKTDSETWLQFWVIFDANVQTTKQISICERTVISVHTVTYYNRPTLIYNQNIHQSSVDNPVCQNVRTLIN